MTTSTSTATPDRSVAPEQAGSHGAFAGTGSLLRFLLRRDRIKLPAWTGGLGLFVLYLVAALPTIAATEEDLLATSDLFADPVGRLLIGPGYGFDAPTYASFIANGYGLYYLIIAALMSILLVARHTRVEEQTGRAELVRANVVGRHAPLTATMILAVLTNLIGGVVVAVLMIAAGGFPATGSLVFAASIAAVGVAFAGVTAVTVQLSEYSRAASGMAGAVLGAGFAIRAAGDMAEAGGSALSWLSPLAWSQQTAPFVLDRWWPLALPLVLALLTTSLAFRLSSRRDLGASLVAVRPGAARGAPSLGTPLGLAFRLQRASIIGWGASLAVAGLLFGAYADALVEAVADLPDVFVEMFGEADLIGGYMAYMAEFLAYLGGAYAVMAVQGYRNEETTGRAEPVLATPMSRWTWLGSNLAVSALGVVAVMVVAGLGTGVGAAVVTGDVGWLPDLLLAHLNQVPAVLVVLGVAALLFGALPRAVGAAWALVGFALFAGTFGPMMELPQAAMNLSPFAHPAELPAEPFAAAPLVALLAVAVIAAAVGLATFRRRAVTTA